MDTTKDVYDDSEAPEYQVYVLNGTSTNVPWKDVPGQRKWLTVMDDAALPAQRYKVRVPIARAEVSAVDDDGKPVDPDSGKVCQGGFYYQGLNPQHTMAGMLGHCH